MADVSPASQLTLSRNPVVEEARKRYERTSEWESTSRTRTIEDIKFRHGDSDNNYQWPNSIRRTRDGASKPSLTINQINQHNLQIQNDTKKNKQSVTFRAVGGAATKASADAMRVLMRRIEYNSNAQDIYSTACEFQVDGGIGWWRLCTRYVDNDSFDQEIYLLRVPDPLAVYSDINCREKDKSDAKYGFVFDDVPKEAFERDYPDFRDMAGKAPLGAGTLSADAWRSEDHVRVCEYFRKVPVEDDLYEFLDPLTRARRTLRASRAPREVIDSITNLSGTRHRRVKDWKVEWFLIVGEQIVDQTEWPGQYIPLIPVIGTEIVVDGIMDRKGHTRNLKDAQRMYNYNASAQVEYTALQGKTPWLAPAKAIEELEVMWNTANTQNHSVLIYNHLDDSYPDKPIPPPQRLDPPNMSPAFQAGMEQAFNQLMMASGQWQNQMGMMGNERTGAAIELRQHQSDTAVFHFQDNYASALRNTGRQILDLIPRVYDTERVLKALNDDGEEYDIKIDPAAAQPLQEIQDQNQKTVLRILNPSLGKYDVEADVGPSFSTRREETVDTLTLILTQAPALTGLIGDLLLGAMGFKEADEAALRLRRMLPPQALGKGPSPTEQALQQQVGALQAALVKSLDVAAKDRLKLAGKDQMRDIDVYEAETARMKALGELMGEDLTALRAIISQLVGEALQTHLAPIVAANRGGLAQQADETTAPPAAPNAFAGAAPPQEWASRNTAHVRQNLMIGPLVRPLGAAKLNGAAT